MRAPPLVPAIAIAALLAAAPVAAAAPASPSRQFVSVDFKLAPHGLHVHLESHFDEVTLEIARGSRAAVYQVQGETTEAGVKARFGKLGSIDVGFQPTKTLSVSKPPKECKGEPWTSREGLFTGTIQFTGEREYAQIEATRAKGKMNVTSHWQCREKRGPIRLNGAPRLSIPDPLYRSKTEDEPATLNASSRRCRCGFAAFGIRHPNGRGPTFIYGAKAENREGMKIDRITYARPGPSAFVFDHEAGTATVRPPHPFTGNATFKRRPRGPDLWRSSIRVPLLGADPISFRGRAFRVSLRRDFPGD